MKKFLIILFFPIFLFAQDKPDWEYEIDIPISAFFPQRVNYLSDKYTKSQNTYYEYNWTSNNLKRLVTKDLKLNYINDESKSTKSNIIDVYKTGFGRTIDELTIKYNVFNYYGFDIVSSIEVKGSHTQVKKFFIFLYNSLDVQSGNLPDGQAVKSIGQEDAVYSIKNGVASVKIFNTAYNNINEFKVDFEKYKEKYKKDKIAYELENEVKRVENIEFEKKRKKEWEEYLKNKEIEKEENILKRKEVLASIPVESQTIYFFKKNGNKITFQNNRTPNEELKKLIVKESNNHKNGQYTAYVVITTTKDVDTYSVTINNRN